MCYCYFVFFFISYEVDIPFNLCSIIPFHYKKEKRSMWVQKLFIRGPAWVNIDKWWICSDSCFHNEVKWNVKCSKIPATPIQKFTWWGMSSLLSSNRFFCCCYVLVLCLCLCNLIAGPDFLFLQINRILITFWVCFLKIM